MNTDTSKETQLLTEELESLGFSTATKVLREMTEKKRKLAIAYEHYRFVRQEKIDAFNEKLRKKAEEYYHDQTLTFTPVGQYPKIPPPDVRQALKEALERKCFDAFEIAHIVEVREDPILFGRVNGCSDRFFVAQWDHDVTIEEILAPNEG